MNELFNFLEELSRNNNREWFKARKGQWDELRARWLADLDRMIAAMAVWDPSLATMSGKEAAYRIYRDTRFSPDKTPYKTYVSAAVSAYGRKTTMAGYYIQAGVRHPAENGLYGGLWCPEPAVLKKLRHAIVDNDDEWRAIVDEPQLAGLYPGWVGERLKTIPKGWDRNHPMAEVLRLKDYGKFHRLDRAFFEDECWPERAAELMRPLKPLIDFLNYSINE